MPFEIYWEKKGFYSRFWGTVTGREIAAKNIGFSNDPRCDRCHYQILDGTDIEAFNFTENSITDIASNDIGMCFYLKNLSVVLVSSKPKVREFYQQYISTCLRMNLTWKFHVCDTLDQAREWLDACEKHRLDRQNSVLESIVTNGVGTKSIGL